MSNNDPVTNDNDIDTGYDEDEVNDHPAAWDTVQQPSKTTPKKSDLLWKLGEDPEVSDNKELNQWTDPNDTYFLLKAHDFESLKFGGQGIEKVYISTTAYERELKELTIDASLPFLFAGEPVLPVRTESGSSQFVQSGRRYKRDNRSQARTWRQVYADSVQVAEIRNFRTRYVPVDPAKLKLYLRPCFKLDKKGLTKVVQSCGIPSDAYEILDYSKSIKQRPRVGLVRVCEKPSRLSTSSGVSIRQILI